MARPRTNIERFSKKGIAMPLDPAFQFNQSNLQDYKTCPRRFYLRYVQQLDWPAIESEPVQEAERLAQLGTDFHRLVHQHLVGLNEALLTGYLAQAGPELRTWWQNYLNHRPALLTQAQTYPELTLSAPLRGHRLQARFDLLAVHPSGQLVIIDWKTARQKPSRNTLARRLQTRVYPYVLARAGAAYNGGRPVNPADIQLVYWYPAAPARPEEFTYSNRLLERDEQILGELIEQVKTAAQTNNFPLVAGRKPCRFCTYRSYCNRGEKAGPLAEWAGEPQEVLDVSALDWDQIAEIQF